MDTTKPIELAEIAHFISKEIDTLNNPDRLLVRGVQSGKHAQSKKELISTIVEKGCEYENTSEPGTIFAATYDKAVITQILEGFHVYKPKSEERPQYPVDLWLVYDASAYSNVEYMHPRHKVKARDKWQRITPDVSGLIGLIVVN